MTQHRDSSNVNQMLGYPADARLLIVNADDFGMCNSVNQAISQSFRTGIVSSTSLMVPCPWSPQSIGILRSTPELPFAVHLTLVAEHLGYRWGPVASRNDVRSLLDESGYFFVHARIPELLARAEIKEVEIEYRAQIDSVLRQALQPTHFDWHCIGDGGRQDIFELTVALAKEFGVALRVHDRAYADALEREGLPTIDYGVVDSYSLGWEGKSEIYAQMLRELPVGLSEWAVHPGLGDDEAQAMEPEGWRVRKADFDFVTSETARTIVAEEGIILTDYRQVQNIWRDQLSTS